MSKLFTTVAVAKPRHNTFDLSHERKFAAEAGNLIPCFVAETVPNDTFTIATSQLIRMSPMLAPVMGRISAYIHFWFVPNRICWSGWEDFINGGVDGEEAPVFPFVNPAGFPESSLFDYMGLPPQPDSYTPVSAIPFFAYTKIWYEYYRDQNLTNSAALEDILGSRGTGLADGDNTTIEALITQVRRRAWQHDYFTSALPWTQRGPEATIPLGVSAALSGTGNLTFDGDSPASSRIQRVDNTAFAANDVTYPASSGLDNDAQITVIGEPAQINVTGHTYVDPSGLTVDLSTATAASINDLRRAFRLQEWLELNARAGARYNETIKAHFGISPGDARLQRPQFLGGSRAAIQISEVLQTSSSDVTTPQGNMAGHGVSMQGKNVAKYTCKEHGYIIGIMSILPMSTYQQGIPKHFLKFDKFDYFWRQFANIGEQPIVNKELYFEVGDPNNDDVFGYTPRYAEYKYINSSVHGPFRSTLDFWHMGRIFASRPLLTSLFVQMQGNEIDRIFAVPSLTNEQFYIHMFHSVKARRPMPYFGTPTI